MANWRDSARNVRFFYYRLSGNFSSLQFFCCIYGYGLLFLLFSLTLFFSLLERWVFTVSVFLRWLRAYVAGPRKIAQPWWKYK